MGKLYKDESMGVEPTKGDLAMRAVLVTTQHRGVFFGYLPEGADRSARSLTVQNARCAMYWSGRRGFLGLASHGPEDGSKIGARAPGDVLLHDITSVADVSDDAAKRWESFQC